MTPLEIHERAMHFSFLAKQARALKDEENALNNYEEAAKLESDAADYYFDKVDLEPTRSTLIRSAAFLNLKAGLPEKAEKYIFHGLINAKDELIKEQLYDALELCVAYKSLNKQAFSGNIEFIYRMRQRSIFYVIEPKSPTNGSAVSLDMISDFSYNYKKSLIGYSKSEYRTHWVKEYPDREIEEQAIKDFEGKIDPVVTNAGFGSFKFSLGVNFLSSFGDTDELLRLKSNILLEYHNNVLVQDFSDQNIEAFKRRYSPEEIDEIFRPLANMRSNKAAYKVNYYDRETLKKTSIGKVKEIEKKKLLPARTITTTDIGLLEQVITHTRETDRGGSARSVILKKLLKSSSFDYPFKVIESNRRAPLILTQEIVVNVDFNSNEGFTLTYDELNISSNDITFNGARDKFQDNFISRIRSIVAQESPNLQEQQYMETIKRIVSNPEAV